MARTSVDAVVRAAADLAARLDRLTPEERFELGDVLGLTIFPFEWSLRLVASQLVASRKARTRTQHDAQD
jgi:hypothetical protein